jgi:hypothetical protein
VRVAKGDDLMIFNPIVFLVIGGIDMLLVLVLVKRFRRRPEININPISLVACGCGGAFFR